MKIFRHDITLTPEQLNDLYNYITEDGNRDIDFRMFEEFITCLVNNKKYSEDIVPQISVKQNQYQLIRGLIGQLSKIKEFETFRDFILSNLDSYQNNIFDWSEDLLNDLHAQITRHFHAGDEDTEDFLRLFSVEEAIEDENRKRATSLSLTSRYSKLKQGLKARFARFVGDFEHFKDTEPSSGANKIFFDFIKLNQETINAFEEITDINDQYNSYINILNQNIEELKLIMEKSKIKENELFAENNRIKNQNENLEIELFAEKENVAKVKLELRIQQQEAQSLEQRINEYESNIFEKQSYIENLAMQKSRLTTKLDDLQTHFENFTKSISEEQKIMTTMKERESVKISSMETITLTCENEKLVKENDDLREELEHQRAYNAISEKQIVSLQKHIEELEVLNRNFQRFDEKRNEPTEESVCNLDMDLSLEHIPEVMSINMSNKVSNLQELATTRRISYHLTNAESINVNRYVDNEYEREPPIINTLKEIKSSMQIMTDMNMLIQRRDASPEISRRTSYLEYIYQCFDSYKKLQILVFKNDTIYILHRDTSKKPLLEIKMIDVEEIVISRDNPHIVEISYQTSKALNESVVLENPSNGQFLKMLEKSPNYNSDLKKKSETSLDHKPNFKNSYMNFFKDTKKCGFVICWVNTFFTDWNTVFLIHLKNVLVKVTAPDVFKYDDYKRNRKDSTIYKLDDYNVIGNKQKIGLNKEFTFAVKIKNEEIDLVFAAPSLHEKNRWSEVLTS
jgi:hypothetical protein